ncbi:uncharacterized protein L3040_007332 [Drepanopeziza brunnea f. sp. 'multigermtubi']|uniref:uncharacterized protein n=1 Tax=Drepanopeziza brunnea f. sp. 'multigermtubi' TaxID=698441 RepID=UPI00238C88B9|nr:hypothetical protein L3040_007332 [Drepanopeziza brunnea f. sp. 'multigermtubi']
MPGPVPRGRGYEDDMRKMLMVHRHTTYTYDTYDTYDTSDTYYTIHNYLLEARGDGFFRRPPYGNICKRTDR